MQILCRTVTCEDVLPHSLPSSSLPSVFSRVKFLNFNQIQFVDTFFPAFGGRALGAGEGGGRGVSASGLRSFRAGLHGAQPRRPPSSDHTVPPLPCARSSERGLRLGSGDLLPVHVGGSGG